MDTDFAAATSPALPVIPSPPHRADVGEFEAVFSAESLGFALDALIADQGDIPNSAPLMLTAESGGAHSGVWLETSAPGLVARQFVTADIWSDGAAVVDGVLLSNCLAGRWGQIRLRADPARGCLEVPIPSGSYHLQLLDAAAARAVIPAVKPLDLPAAGLAAAIGAVAMFLKSADDCLYLETRDGQIWATAGSGETAARAPVLDGDAATEPLPYRLALPQAAAYRLLKLLTGERVALSINFNQARFEGEGWSLQTELLQPGAAAAEILEWFLDGDGPDTGAVMYRPALEQAVIDAAKLDRRFVNWLSLRFWPGMAAIETAIGGEGDMDSARLSVDLVAFHGAERAATFDVEELRDALSASDCDHVAIKLQGDRATLFFHDDRPGDRPDAPQISLGVMLVEG